MKRLLLFSTQPCPRLRFDASTTLTVWVTRLSCLLLAALAHAAYAQTTILSEGFEGAFPAAWATGDANPTSGTTSFWDDVNAAFGGEGAHTGTWKGHCAGSKYPFDSNEPNPTYDNDMTAFMQQSINLAGVCSARLAFWYKIPSIETCCDRLRVTIDGTEVFTQSNPVAAWTQVTVDLNGFIGAARTLRFEFVSDFSVVNEGAYLDDILVTVNVVPPNNDFSGFNPNLITPSGTVTGNNCAATAEAGEPANSGRTIWFFWTAPSSGCVAFNTQGSAIDTLLCIFTGPSVSSLTPVAACNDDFPGLGVASRVEFVAAQGVTYAIRVDGYQGDQGNIVLNWGADTTPPPNDNFISVIPVSGLAGTVRGNNCTATAEPGEMLDPRGGGRTVWWCWTSPTNGCVFFNTVGSSFDTVMCAYTYLPGSGLSGLTQVGDCNDDFSGKGVASRVEFTAVARQTYFIQVDGYSGNQGNIVLNWGDDTTPPLNDHFANSFFLPGTTGGTARGNNCNATAELDEPGNSGRTVWWRWTAPASGCTYFSTLGSSLDTLLCAYTGAAVNSLTPVACVDDSGGKGLTSRIQFNAVAGTEYRIRVDGFDGQIGDIVLHWGSGPANDDFANATVLSGGSGSVAGQNRCAGAQAGEPTFPGGGGHSVWWRWTPPATACVAISTRGSSFDTALCVYTGAAVNSLTSIACSDDAPGKGFQSRVEFHAFAGVTYWIQVDGFAADEGDITLSFGPDTAPPPNDDFANAIAVSGASGTALGNNCSATLQPGEPTNSFARGQTVWWRWTAPATGCVYFNTVGSSYDTVLCAFRGTALSNLTDLGCNDDASGKGTRSRVEFYAVAGSNYWLQVDGFAGAQGDITLKWGPDTTPPVNDNFASAFLIGGATGRALGNNCNATAEAGEPAFTFGAGNTVWWRWTAPASGCFYFSTLGSSFDTVECVYTGVAVNALSQVACNDDAGGKGVMSRVEFNAVSGTTYWIRVDRYNGPSVSQGDIVLTWGGQPANDNFANAFALFDQFGTTVGHNRCATGEAGEPANTGRTVWWNWTAPGGGCGNYIVNTAGSTFDTVLCVFTGGAVNALTEVACNDDFPGLGTQSQVQFTVTPGTTYRIRVDSYDAITTIAGDITLNWGPAGPPPANDNFAGAIVISGASGSTTGANCGATREAFEPVDGAGRGKTVWWSWTAPASGCAYFGTVGSTYDTVLCVYRGSSPATLTPVGCNDDYPGQGLLSRVEFTAVSGQTYWVQVDGFVGRQGNIVLNWGSDTTPPVNDNFVGATPLSGDHGSVGGNNCNATAEAGEPGNNGRTVWWSWTAPNSGHYAFRTLGSTFDTIACVFTGPNLASLTQITCVDDTTGKGLASRAEFDAISGTTYWIRVDGFDGQTGDIALSWGCWANLRIDPLHKTHVVISWSGSDFTLQSTTELRDTGSVWTDIPGASPVVLPAAAISQFFRLRCEISGGGALPDLIINPAAASPFIVTETFAAGNCEVVEGCAVLGTRRLLRFGTETRNIGTANLALGNPAGNPLFVYASCHGHYHFQDFASYRLRAGNGTVVATGGKVGFCLLDGFRWNPAANPASIYNCSFQGIQAGWADVYNAALPCQYIDITGLPAGNYTLEMTIDPANRLPESNETNNSASVPVTIP